MQNSIKVENAVLGETTFSGGISTTTDPRLGAEGEGSGGSSKSSDVVYVDRSNTNLTYGQVFELTKKNVVITSHNAFIYRAYLIGSGARVNITIIDMWNNTEESLLGYYNDSFKIDEDGLML